MIIILSSSYPKIIIKMKDFVYYYFLGSRVHLMGSSESKIMTIDTSISKQIKYHYKIMMKFGLILKDWF